MQLKTLGLVTSLLASSLLSAQSGSIDFEFGQVYAFPKKHMDLGFWGSEKEGLVQLGLRMNKDLMVLPVNTSDYSVGQPDKIDLRDMGAGFNNDGFLHLQNNYYWFYSLWDKENEKEQLYVRPFDVRNSRFSSTDKKVIEAGKMTGSLMSTGFYRFNVTDKYDFQSSQDGSKLLVTYRLRPEEKKDKINKDVIGFQVFDQNMEKLWGQELKMPYTEAQMDNLDYDIDSQGNVYMLARVYDDVDNKKEKKKDKTPKYHFEILRINGNSKQPEIVKIDLGTKFPTGSPIISEDGKGNLVCVGYYANKARSAGINGVFMYKIDSKTGSIASYGKGFYEIPLDVLKQSESKRKQKKIDKKADKDEDVQEENLTMHSIYFDPDGSITVIGEEFYIVDRSYYDSKGVYHRVINYYYEDILALKINEKSEVAWMVKIPKRQRGGAARGGMSFYHSRVKDKDYFLFLDNKKNLDLSADETPAWHQDGAGGFLTSVSVDKNGKIDKQNLFDSKEQKVRIQPADFESIADGRVAVRATVKKLKGKILVLSFR